MIKSDQFDNTLSKKHIYVNYVCQHSVTQTIKFKKNKTVSMQITGFFLNKSFDDD